LLGEKITVFASQFFHANLLSASNITVPQTRIILGASHQLEKKEASNE
jgi:hypothetical protein